MMETSHQAIETGLVAPMSAQTVIDCLALQRHPEGGWFRETFRDKGEDRGTDISTAIYYLLEAGQKSHWHRLHNASEVWHFHLGAPLQLELWNDGLFSVLRLGTEIASGYSPQAVVPKLVWQSARSLGSYSLMSCTVAPAFDFDAFELAPRDWSPCLG